MRGQPSVSATTRLYAKPRATGILSKIAHMPFIDANRDVAKRRCTRFGQYPGGIRPLAI